MINESIKGYDVTILMPVGSELTEEEQEVEEDLIRWGSESPNT